jgi:hypothetical protein
MFARIIVTLKERWRRLPEEKAKKSPKESIITIENPDSISYELDSFHQTLRKFWNRDSTFWKRYLLHLDLMASTANSSRPEIANKALSTTA